MPPDDPFLSLVPLIFGAALVFFAVMVVLVIASAVWGRRMGGAWHARTTLPAVDVAAAFRRAAAGGTWRVRERGAELVAHGFSGSSAVVLRLEPAEVPERGDGDEHQPPAEPAHVAVVRCLREAQPWAVRQVPGVSLAGTGALRRARRFLRELQEADPGAQVEWWPAALTDDDDGPARPAGPWLDITFTR